MVNADIKKKVKGVSERSDWHAGVSDSATHTKENVGKGM